MRLERWFFDPYDGAHDGQAACSVADDERLDDLLENHPLSKLRRWLDTVARSLAVDDEFRPALDDGWAPSNPQTRIALQVPAGMIGLLYLMSGRPDVAEASIARLIPRNDSAPAVHEADTAELLMFLGLAREAQGKVDEAAEALDLSLRIFQGTVGEPDIRTARAGCHLGRMRVARGRLEEAEPLLQQALAIFAERGADSDAAVAANDLGLVCQQRNDHGAAVRWFEMADTRFERAELAQGGPIPDRARVLNNLGVSLDSLGDRQGAKAARARARTVASGPGR